MCVKCTASWEMISFYKWWGNRLKQQNWCNVSCQLIVQLGVNCSLIFSVAYFLPPKSSARAVCAAVVLPDHGLGCFWGAMVLVLRPCTHCAVDTVYPAPEPLNAQGRRDTSGLLGWGGFTQNPILGKWHCDTIEALSLKGPRPSGVISCPGRTLRKKCGGRKYLPAS